MTKLRTRVFATLAAVAAALTVSATGSAQAEPKGKGAESAAQNCTFEVQTRATQCFRTLTEAVFHVTQGRVANAPADARKLAADKGVTAQLNAPASSLVLGIFYYWENYGQPSLIFWSVSGQPCTGPISDVDYGAPWLPDYTSTGGVNWNNNIRSFKAFNVEYPAGVINYNNCYANLFDLPFYVGDSTGYLPSSSDLGVMRDRAESILWS